MRFMLKTLVLGLGVVSCALTRPASGQETVDLPASDTPLRAERTPVYSIGGIDAPAWASFQTITEAAFDTDGNLILLDGPARRLVVVDTRGALVRQLGRAGGGPGEFTRPGDMAVLESGSIAVIDRASQRLTLFGADGSLILDRRVLNGGAYQPRSIVPLPGQRLAADAFLYTLNGTLSARSEQGISPIDSRPIQWLGLEDESVVTMHHARTMLRPKDPQGGIGFNAFFPEFRMASTPAGRVVIADTGAYALTVLGPDGRLERVLRRARLRTAVTDRMRQAERDRLLADLANGKVPGGVATFGTPPSRESLEAQFKDGIERMHFPDSLPAITNLQVDGEGMIWALRSGASPQQDGPIDILDPDGRYIGTLALDEPAWPLALGPGGLAAFITLDALDVPTVRVERIEIHPR